MLGKNPKKKRETPFNATKRLSSLKSYHVTFNNRWKLSKVVIKLKQEAVYL